MFLGIFYREFTKINGFSGKTVLGGLHTHALTLGAFFFLIVMLLEKSYELTKNKRFNAFYISYNIGLLFLIIMMLVRGCIEVSGLEISKMADASISGFAGLSHIVMAIAYVLFFLILLDRVKAVDSKK